MADMETGPSSSRRGMSHPSTSASAMGQPDSLSSIEASSSRLLKLSSASTRDPFTSLEAFPLPHLRDIKLTAAEKKVVEELKKLQYVKDREKEAEVWKNAQETLRTSGGIGKGKGKGKEREMGEMEEDVERGDESEDEELETARQESLMLEIDRAKKALMDVSGKAVIQSQIMRSLDQSHVISRALYSPDKETDMKKSRILSIIKERDSLQIELLKLHKQRRETESKRVQAVRERMVSQSQSRELLSSIKSRTSEREAKIKEEMDERTKKRLKNLQDKTTVSLNRREILRNVLQGLILESSADWINDPTLLEILLQCQDKFQSIHDEEEEDEQLGVLSPLPPAVTSNSMPLEKVTTDQGVASSGGQEGEARGERNGTEWMEVDSGQAEPVEGS